jgi:hypothetical protein
LKTQGFHHFLILLFYDHPVFVPAFVLHQLVLFVPYGIAPAVTAAKKRYAPYARKPYKSVDYAGKGRCAAAEYGRYKIKLEYAHKAPVDRADYH